MKGDGLSDIAIVARRLYPELYDPDQPWSRELWDRRTAARKEASRIIAADPAYAADVLRAHRKAVKEQAARRRRDVLEKF